MKTINKNQIKLTTKESIRVQYVLDRIGCDYLITAEGIEVLELTSAVERLIDNTLLELTTLHAYEAERNQAAARTRARLLRQA